MELEEIYICMDEHDVVYDGDARYSNLLQTINYSKSKTKGWFC